MVVIVSMFTVAWIREYKAYSVFSKSIDKRNQTQFVFLYLLGSIFQETLQWNHSSAARDFTWVLNVVRSLLWSGTQSSHGLLLWFVAVLTMENCCLRAFVNFFSETDGYAQRMPDLRELYCMLQFYWIIYLHISGAKASLKMNMSEKVIAWCERGLEVSLCSYFWSP